MRLLSYKSRRVFFAFTQVGLGYNMSFPWPPKLEHFPTASLKYILELYLIILDKHVLTVVCHLLFQFHISNLSLQ